MVFYARLIAVLLFACLCYGQSPAVVGSQEDQEADLHDQAVLSTTLYVSVSAEDIHNSAFVRELAEKQAEEMVAASERLVARQGQRMQQAKQLIEMGKLTPEVWTELSREMKKRSDTAYAAIDRARTLQLVIEAAKAEERTNPVRRRGGPMEKYAGNGAFTPADFRVVSVAFNRRFGRQLPVSADGDTSLHRALGLDHHGRIDVAVQPDSIEGTWLRRYLERLHIPYYAFRKAIIGSATAPHIHIGPGSTRFARRRG
ncbi:MAG TPA: hypothetical protein VMZ52_13395 [Bryobacteraceae bacterium]|nr:hypothetical protein [Bryobacteraceae bacterium]